MKSNQEMRNEAWGALFARRWFGRLIAVALLFFAINMSVQTVLSSACEAVGVMTVEDYRMENKLAKLTGENPPPKPRKDQLPGIFAATAFVYFILLIFGGIAAYGRAGVQLKAAREEGEDWFKGTLGGFRQPFGMLALTFRQAFQIFLWTLLFIVPGLIAAYRYRNAWYVKVDHPDWSAGACLAESGRLMRGKKLRAFCFDLSYWRWLLAGILGMVILLAGIACAAAKSLPVVARLGGVLVCFGGLGLYLAVAIVLACYMNVGHAVFYRELLADEPQPEPAPEPEAEPADGQENA